MRSQGKKGSRNGTFEKLETLVKGTKPKDPRAVVRNTTGQVFIPKRSK